MGTKLYVGNLSYRTTEDELKTLFSEIGTVESAKVITDKYTGQSKGFGFVEMSSNEEAQSAISKLNGQNYKDRPLTVSEAKPQEKREGGGRGGERGPGGDRGGRFGGGGRRG
jgi:RNA recognition motif-containing protein